MVLLIGNYPLDQQQSMQRFATMMLQGLTDAGVTAELIRPEPIFGTFHGAGRFVAKWLAYIDKFFVFPARLRHAVARNPAVIHICDHSNAMYAGNRSSVPTVVTCHDLLAVRGAFGEQTDCPASFTGGLLQRWIVRGLRRASAIACDSTATLLDAERLVTRGATSPKLSVVPVGLNHPFRHLPREAALARLTKITGLRASTPFLLHVGSNLRRKNREGVLRIFAACKNRFDGQLMFAGDALSPELVGLSKELGIDERVVNVAGPDADVLEALYNCAAALLFPSRFEGFGWPVIEAQASGCPVVCSNAGPLPEVAGDAALLRDVDDEDGFAHDVLRLNDPAERARWSDKGLANARRYEPEEMVSRYIEVYRGLGAQL